MTILSKYIQLTALVISVAISSLFFSACKKSEGYNGPVSTDPTKPGIVTNIKVTNFNGGAHITYTLPSSPNLLYVLAKYSIRENTPRETKSSYYSDTITVDGFKESKEYSVTLFSVSRANVVSDSVVVTVHPDTPYYKLIKPTIALSADFGGVNVTALNPSRQPIGIILISLDATTKLLEIQGQHFTDVDSINYSARGFDTLPRRFGAYITDRFGNASDTAFITLQPLFETLLDKSKFFTYRLPTDAVIYSDWNVSNLWNNKTDDYSAGWHTESSSLGLPILATFSIGVTARLSRFILWNRPNQYSYSHGNPKTFTLWGSNEASPQNATMPRYSAVGTVVGDWVNMANYRFPDPPSGSNALSPTDADRAYVAAGVGFNIPIAAPRVKFLRVGVSDTWSGGDFAHIMEMSFYGDPR